MITVVPAATTSSRRVVVAGGVQQGLPVYPPSSQHNPATPAPAPSSGYPANPTLTAAANTSPFVPDLSIPYAQPGTLPPGQWVMDNNSAMHWSGQLGLFYHLASGQYYCPTRKEWFNPVTRTWAKLG